MRVFQKAGKKRLFQTPCTCRVHPNCHFCGSRVLCASNLAPRKTKRSRWTGPEALAPRQLPNEEEPSRLTE